MNPFRLSEIPNEARADVEKHRITEEEETKRVAHREQEETRRKKEETKQKARATEGYYWVRFVLIVAPLAAWGFYEARGCTTASEHETTERARLGVDAGAQ